MVGIHVAVTEDNVVEAVVHALFCLMAQVVECGTQSLTCLCTVDRTVFGSGTLEEDRQFHGVEALVTDVTEYIELCVVQNRMRQTHHLTVGFIGIQDARAYATDILGKAHHQILTDGVDGGVGNLCELLTEIVEEDLRLVGKHCQRCVVTHGSRRLLTVHTHRHDGVIHIFLTVAEHHLLLQEVIDGVAHVATALQFLQLDTVGAQPLTIGMFVSQLLLDLTVVVDLTLLRIDEQDLTGLQTALFGNFRRIEIHHTHFTGHHHHVVLGDGIARGTQTVTVEQTTGEAAVAEEQCGRTVPRLHQDGMIFVESLQIFGNGVLVVETLRHHHSHSVRQ